MTTTNLRNVHTYVANRELFTCNKTLTGSHERFCSKGHLPPQFRDDFDKATDAQDFYVVHSYATPIAWFANGEWTVPNVKYSVTTSRHMSATRVRSL